MAWMDSWNRWAITPLRPGESSVYSQTQNFTAPWPRPPGRRRRHAFAQISSFRSTKRTTETCAKVREPERARRCLRWQLDPLAFRSRILVDGALLVGELG